jgi:hypothetical protein
MWVGMKSTDVSESYIASIFRIEEWAKQSTSKKHDFLLATLFACCLFGLLLGPDDGSNARLRNIGNLS